MKKIVTFGEIMLRLSPAGFLRFSQAASLEVVYGGGESNVAVSLANFGLPTEFVSRLPANELGDCALMELRKRQVGIRHVLRGGERLGIYFLEMGAVSRGSKVIYDRANSSMATIHPGMINWEAVFEDACWFHWTGITPALSLQAAEVCLEAIQAANRLGVRVSVDLNYRKNLWKYGKKPAEIMPALVEGCDIILGNEEDAEKHFGLHPEQVDVTRGDTVDASAYRSVLQQLMKLFPRAQKTIATLRGSISASHNSWSGLMYDGSQFFESPTYQITHIVDRVGGGDSFMAGLIYGLLTWPGDDQKALDFAVAASCLKHTIFGDANLATVAEVEALMKGDASGRVSR
jgi:2-dehydro-3-deoxygluconokinase